MGKLSKIIDVLKSKWMRNTSKTIILIAIIIGLFIGINVLMQHIDPKDIDLTKEQIYTLSEESKKALEALPDSDEIKIYMFDFNEQDGPVELIRQYERLGKNIKLEVTNAEDRPDLASKYNIITGMYTIIIECGEKNKFYTQYDLYNQDYNTGDTTDITEQRITNGIIGVSSIGKTTPIYMLSGHEEITSMMYLSIYLELENYELKQLDLLSSQNIPEDCKVLIIASPKKDFMEGETNLIKEYIQKGGNILWLNDPFSATAETPNIKSVLDMYGVNIRQDGYIVEQEEDNMITGSPSYIYPRLDSNEITSGITRVLLPGAGKLEFADNLNDLGVTKTDILSSGDKSFYRTNLEVLKLTPQEDEKEETSVIASILEKKIGNNEENSNESEEITSKLVVFASNAFASDAAVTVGNQQVLVVGLYQNKDLIMNAIEYVAEIEDPITIRKTISVTQYTATEAQTIRVLIIIFTLPAIIILLGIVVWILRRRKK